MNKILLSTFFFTFLLSNLAYGQIDQDGQTLSGGVTIDCNNLDIAQFESDLEGLLQNFTFTDNNNNTCNGNLSYEDDSWNIISSFPLDCDQEVEVEVDIDCDGSIQTITVMIQVEDMDIPYDFNGANVIGNLIDPANTNINQCDLASLQADFDAWWMDIENNGPAGDEFFEDACDNGLDIVATVLVGPDHGICLDQTTLDVEFEVTDDCGNVFTETYTYNVTDDEAPISIGNPPTAPFECDSNVSQSDLDDWVDDILSNGPGGNSYFDDVCQDESLTPLDISVDGSVPILDFTACPAMTYTIDFIVADACGNSETFSFDFELEDNNPATIDLNGLSQASVPECDGTAAFWAAIQTDMENLVATQAVVMDDCSDYTGVALDINDFEFTPPLGGLSYDDVTVNGGNPCLAIEFEITWEDPCDPGNTSAPAFFTYEIDDTVGPEDGDPGDPWTTDYTVFACPGDPINWDFDFNTIDNCSGEMVTVAANDAFDFFISEASCGLPGEASFLFEDDCGNTTEHTIDYDIVPSAGPLVSFNTTEALMFGIGFTECDGEECYTFTEAGGNYHDDPVDVTVTFNAFPEIGVDFDGGCPPYEIAVSHTPGGGPPGNPLIQWAGAQDCIPYDEPTTVQWEIFDQCGSSPLLIEFEVLVECSACPGNGIIAPERCNTCNETDPNMIPDPDCHACDSDALSFQSCTPVDPDQGGQPPTLCMGVGVPHNMSWFSFIAGTPTIDVEVDPLDCFAGTGAVGIQAGIYDECFTEGGTCLAGDASCTGNLDAKTFALTDLTPGETYFIFVDGCNGAACNYVITVEEQEPFVVHTPIAVVAESCGETFGECDIENEMMVCPGSPMNFTVWHDGDGTGDEGSCTEYNPDSEGLLFLWDFYDGDMNLLDWAGLGTNLSAEFSITNDGFRLPDDILAPTTPGVYNICIEQVSRPPCTFAANQACMEITVQDPPVETYAWEVCVEDLEVGPNTFGPFDPGLGGSVNPNGDTYAWLGTDVSRADVESWTEENPDWPGHICNTFLNMDPVCGCIIPQQVCINMRGDLDKTNILAYMYECQFYDFQNQGSPSLDFDIEEYEWEWTSSCPQFSGVSGNDQTFELQFDEAGAQCFNIDGFHPHIDNWQGNPENCDTIPNVTVLTTRALIKIDTIGCFDYMAHLDFEAMNDLDIFDEWPEIDNFPGAVQIEFIDCDSGALLASNLGTQVPDPSIEGGASTLSLTGESEVCVRMSYSFPNGAWWNQEDNSVFDYGCGSESCSSVFGPFDWGNGTPPIPQPIGDNEFCASDLLGKTFEVMTIDPLNTYEWSVNPASAGTFPNGNTGTSTTIDFTSSTGPITVEVIAITPCGPSDAGTIQMTFNPAPEVNIAAIADVCVDSAPDPNAMTTVTVTANVTGGSGNLQYNWDNSGNVSSTTTNTTTYTYSSAGPQMVTVTVDDLDTGCSSLVSAPADFTVIDNLEPPILDCPTRTLDAIEFSWTEVDGAVGYEYFLEYADGTTSATTTTDAVTFTHLEGGLALDEQVIIHVIALGDQPCFNSASVSLDCRTTNCADNQIDNQLVPLEFCQGDPLLTVIDLSGAISAVPGDFVFSSTPAGISSDGLFDPTALAPGDYDITVEFTPTSGGTDCGESRRVTYTIIEQPLPMIPAIATICETGGATITQGGTGNLIGWSYTDANGDSVIPTSNPDGTISFDAPGTYTVTLTTGNAQCENFATAEVIVQEQPGPVVFTDCIGDFSSTTFNWEAVTGAVDYDLSYTIDGAAPMNELGWGDVTYTVNGLNEGAEVILTVIANMGADFVCDAPTGVDDCTASACAVFQPAVVNCVEDADGSIVYTWTIGNPAIDMFIVSIDGMVIGEQAELTYTQIGVPTNESGEITVEPVHPQAVDGCTIAVSTASCTIPCDDLPVMGPVTCGVADLDFVTFNWEDVDNSEDFEVTVTLEDGTVIIDTIQATTWLQDGLAEDEVVNISVIALNPVAGCDNSQAEGEDCTATNCIIPSYEKPLQVICWDPASGPIALTEAMVGEITDQDGNTLPGDLVWIDGDSLDPDADASMSYVVAFTFTNDADGCMDTDDITIQVNVQPAPAIMDIDDVCEGTASIIQAEAVADPSATIEWDWGVGVSSSNDGAGPHRVTFPDNGLYEVTLTVSSAADCSSTATAMVNVDEQLEITFSDCIDLTNDSVTFVWDAIDGAADYSWSLDNGDTGTTDTNSVMLGGLDTGVDYTITVTANVADNECEIMGMMTCTPTSCPQSTFDPAGTYTFGEYCPEDLEAVGIVQLGGAELLIDAPNEAIESETWTGSAAVNESTGLVDLTLLDTTNGTVTETVTYTVVYAANGCSYSTDLTITANPGPSATIAANDPDCILDEVPTITIMAQGGVAPYTYEWANNPPSQTDPVYAINNPGTYEMIVTDANGCTVMEIIDVLPADTPEVIIDGPSTIFNGDTGDFNYVLTGTTAEVSDVIWYIDTDQDGEFEILELDGDINLTIEAFIEEYGRQFELRVEVYFSADCFIDADYRVDIIDIEKWYIPNVISPATGGDNRGDNRWRMYTKGGVTVQKYSIYDRWGELVFFRDLDPMVDAIQLTGPDESAVEWTLDWFGEWGTTGTNEGQAEQGVYVYVIEMVIDEGGPDERIEIEAGDITVFR